MKMKRRISLLIALMLITTLLAGCSLEEKELVNAIIKCQDITSAKTSTNIKFDLEVLEKPKLEKEQQEQYNNIVKIINDFELNLNTKSMKNKEKSYVKAQIDLDTNFQGNPINTSIWIDSDMSSNKFSVNEIIKLPEIVKMYLPQEVQDIDYLVISTDSLSEEAGTEEIDMTKFTQLVEEYQTKFQDQIFEYVKKHNSEFNLVTKKSDSAENSVYVLKFDDKQFKDFIRENLIDILNDKEIYNLVRDYIKDIAGIAKEDMDEDVESFEDIENKLSDFKDNLPKIIKKVNEIFDAFDKYTILGKDGYTVEYVVDKDGNLVKQTGMIDIIIDPDKFAKILASLNDKEEPDGPTAITMQNAGKYNLKINYTSNISDINKDIEIKLPELTEKNSIDYMKLIELQMRQINDGLDYIIVLVDGEYVFFDVDPYIEEGTTIVPVRALAEEIGATVEWNDKAKKVTITKDDLSIELTIDKTKALVNGKTVQLDAAATIVDGSTCVPLRFVSESFGAEVEWDAKTRVINISTK